MEMAKKPFYNYKIDLTKKIEHIFKGLRGSSRTAIKKAEREKLEFVNEA